MPSPFPLTPGSAPAGPIHLIVWTESPGRPLASGAPALAALLGAGIPATTLRLDDLLTPAGRRRLDEALAVASETTVDLGNVDLTLGLGEPRWFHLTVHVQPEDSGPATCTATAVDLGVAHHAERALAEKSERLELVLDGTRLGIWDWNPQTGAVQFNARWAEMLGHELSEIPFQLDSWESRVHPDDLADCYADITAHIEGHTDFYENVHRMRHKDGRWLYILDRGKIVRRDSDGNPVRFTGTHTDITAQKLAELEAQEATRAKSLFLATMSHEIRTPLNGVLGLLQVLEGTELTADQRELLALATYSGEHLLVLINDILDLSKIEAGQMSLDVEPTNIRVLVEAIAGLFTEQAREKAVDMRVDLELGDACWFETDPHRLRQVVANLVSNAVKFTCEGSVTLGARAERDGDRCELVLTVADTGKGIADTEAIWEGFRQEEASISRTYGGTGLGLTICRHIAELLGGAIRVTSEVGRGSTFELRLPAAACSAPTDGTPELESAVDDALTHLRVLVAEDNPINQRVATGMFNRLGLEVTVADNGREAIEACAASEFDLVLMDLHMPQLDGLAATRALVRDLGPSCPRIVALSADVSEQGARECRAAGMDGFLDKPFRLGELEALLRETVSRRR